MQAKALEIRDESTFIPVLCVDMNPPGFTTGEEYHPDDLEAQRYLLRRCGYPCDGRPNILITRLAGDGSPATNDPFMWGGRTMPTAHNYIIDNWETLRDGDVIDAEFILGETKAPKVSEREEHPL